MANEEVNNYYQESPMDVNLILTDLEEKTTNLKEKINLISKNFIFLKEETEKKIDKIQDENSSLKKEIEHLKRAITNLSQEADKWIRRDEIVLIERMLKDFQPLEFVRKKDLEELMQESKKESKKILERNKKPENLK
jgi:hypothetical protein